MSKILSFLLIFFVYNNALLAMDNKPYHHLPDVTLAPKYSEVLPSEVDTSIIFNLTKIFKYIV